MTDKAYPTQIPRKRDKTGVWRQQYRGSVAALLLQEEAEHLISILECLYGHDDVTDELGEEIERLHDEINAVVQNGLVRMQQLHGVLGAYDLHSDGKISKPESEKIDYSNYRSPLRPNLELVRKDT